jgi:hypothetical protein
MRWLTELMQATRESPHNVIVSTLQLARQGKTNEDVKHATVFVLMEAEQTKQFNMYSVLRSNVQNFSIEARLILTSQ